VKSDIEKKAGKEFRVRRMVSLPKILSKQTNLTQERVKSSNDWSHPYKVSSPRSQSMVNNWATKRKVPKVTTSQRKGSCSSFDSIPIQMKQRIKENKVELIKRITLLNAMRSDKE